METIFWHDSTDSGLSYGHLKLENWKKYRFPEFFAMKSYFSTDPLVPYQRSPGYLFPFSLSALQPLQSDFSLFPFHLFVYILITNFSCLFTIYKNSCLFTFQLFSTILFTFQLLSTILFTFQIFSCLFTF